MYRPAGSENEVGGDFYDVFRVADGWMLVIGDVTGRGARAASLTAVARYTLRTAATLTDDPVLALETLNRALFARGDSVAVQRRGPRRQRGAARTGEARRRGPSAAAADRGREVEEVAGRRSGPRRLRRCRAGPSPIASSSPASSWSSSPTGSPRHRGRRSASARRGCGRTRRHLQPGEVVQRVEASLQAFTEGAARRRRGDARSLRASEGSTPA